MKLGCFPSPSVPFFTVKPQMRNAENIMRVAPSRTVCEPLVLNRQIWWVTWFHHLPDRLDQIRADAEICNADVPTAQFFFSGFFL